MTLANHEQNPVAPEWVMQIRARGWHSTLLTLLDMLEPIAPLIAQGFFIGQPVAQRWGATWHRDAWQGMAQALESSSARAILRYHLEATHSEATHLATQKHLEQTHHHDNAGDVA